jgi:2Fe-2S ferredoxin
MLIRFIDAEGSERVVEGRDGESAMRCATDAHVEGIVGECGGAMACATCHCYITPDWIKKLPSPSQTELEMLTGVIDPKPESRLSCQIRLSEELSGIIIHVPLAQG